LVVSVLISGCEQVDTETLNKITQEDPSFKPVLERKKELDSKIAFLENQLRDSKSDTSARIRTLQENFNRQKLDIYGKVASLKAELNPARLEIRQEMDSLRGQLANKKEILKNLESTRRNLTNLINQQKAVSVTTEDMRKWQERLADLNKQIEPIAGEVRELEEKLKILRLKLIALRQ
jgi:chromosome segregation ATPase